MTVGLKTLVLNQNYQPISIFPLHHIPVEDAITRVFNGTCHVVLEYDREIRTQNQNVHINWPSVIARNDGKIIGNYVKLSREFLYYRDHALCMYCEKPLSFSEMTIDHVTPRVAGGEHKWENVVSACQDCNQAKGHKLPRGMWKPLVKPEKPTYWQLIKVRKKFPISVYDENWMQFIGDWESDVNVLTRA